ncbi:hypothetical protein KIH86_03710 [Paenibacillus sp. HN-1]|uniref:hypothetical protein n=1 Tax=Paenibacillus TaxID=44249 RepID=UPI001CA8B864|nr:MULTISPECIES: hypothetical protein [Paenibacillus]MBY9077289.1 hypothetical protein [Paenibacillus sp. CGMCC 1.18879]MBY9083336.1 hypothetical protein [Paenibacillus sinensis]
MPDFSEELPEWTAEGIEPPESKKSTGWQVDDHPPAGWFNWLFSRAYAALLEVRSVFSAHKADATAHITEAERTSWNAGATAASIAIPSSQKGAASGVATLDATIKIPAGQLPVSAVQATTADVTYYVRTDGNDNNNGLANTSAGAFKTITKALSMIPPVINHTVVVNVAAGTYAEDVEIKGFSGSGVLQVNPGVVTVSNTYNVSSVTVSNCLIPVGVNGLNATTVTARAFTALNALDAEFKYCSTTLGMVNQHGFYANSAKMYLFHCTATNKYVGISAGQNSEVFVWDCSGTGNAIALYAGEGGRISTTGTVPAGTTASATGNSGSIDRIGVLNPWGDNTYSTRPILWAFRSVDINMPDGGWSNFIFDGASTVQGLNYSTSTGVATISQTGWYQIKASLIIVGMSDSQQGQIRVLHNSVSPRLLDFRRNPVTGSNLLISGQVILGVAAGDTLQIQTYMDGAHTVGGGSDVTRFEIIRLA